MTTSWIATVVATLLAVSLAMAGLGIGAVVGRRGPRRSCGRPPGEACPCDPLDRPCAGGNET